MQVQTQWRQWAARVAVYQQRCLQLVTDIPVVGELCLVQLAAVAGKIAAAPIVSYQQMTAAAAASRAKASNGLLSIGKVALSLLKNRQAAWDALQAC